MAEPLLGLLGEFGSQDPLLDAVKRARKDGFRCIDAFSPYPVEGMAELLALKSDHRIGWITIGGGVFGFVGMLAVQLLTNVDYPIEVGGRPLFAYPAFFVAAFEVMILCAVGFAVAAMLIINGLPRLHDPIFGVPRFGLATEDRFFLYIDSSDPKFDREKTRGYLGSLGACNVEPVRP